MTAAVLVSMYIIAMHIKHWRDPVLQISMCRIVFMIPVYSICSYLSVVVHHYDFYFILVRDCYESYVLYMFFKMLIELADGEETLIQKLEFEKQLRCFMPLCCMHIKPGRIFMHRCKQMILQFVVLKPLLALLIFWLDFAGVYQEGNFSYQYGYLYITIIYNVSFTIALYFLVMFYEAIKHILARYHPLSKFLCIKAVVFFSYWQSILIAIMVHFEFIFDPTNSTLSISQQATGLQDFLICIEMLPLAIAHIKSFGHKSYESIHDDYNRDEAGLYKRIIEVANVSDVFRETFEAIKMGPKRNVFVGKFVELSREEQQALVVKEGWLLKRGEDIAKIWKERFCLLISEPKGLVYFKKNIWELPLGQPPKPRGFVDFRDLEHVAPHKGSQQRFEVITRGRKWHFKVTNNSDRDPWMQAIEKLHGNISIGEEVSHDAVSLEEV